MIFKDSNEYEFGQIIRAYYLLMGNQEHIESDFNDECGLNGESFPNGNAVPITCNM